MDYLITAAQPADALPRHLLLLADENPHLVDTYLPHCQIYLLRSDEQELGICLLQTQSRVGEIMNIAVEPAYQGQGFGKALLNHIIAVARQQHLQRLVIKTGNSSIGQIALYQ